MTISRRALGLGLIAASAAATGGYLYFKDTPGLGKITSLTGFVGGEKRGFINNPETISALRHKGYEVTGRQAGSVEMVREPSLLEQKPDFLWPSSSVMTQIAKENHVAVRRSDVVLNSPLVVYSWENVASALESTGLVRSANGMRTIDLEAYLRAIIAGKSWAELGLKELYGKARIAATNPVLSNSGFMFAGLMANLLAGGEATLGQIDKIGADVVSIFQRMGFKSNSSGSLFDDYIAGGPGAYPMVVIYENQLIEWALNDPARWQRVVAGKTKPVMIYPTPTAYSAHPMLSIKADADGLVDALLTPELQQLAWAHHGFRGALGAPGAVLGGDLPAVPERLDSIVPMPDAAVMLKLLELIGT